MLKSNFFLYNSYNVLGLETSATTRDINKRAKEIIKLLSIDQEPTYDCDVLVTNNIRSIDNVNKALQNLTTPISKLREFMFWFILQDEDDGQSIDLIRKGKFKLSVEKLEDKAEANSKDYIVRKKLALIKSIDMCDALKKVQENEDIDNTKFSKRIANRVSLAVDAWGEVVDNKAFWRAFQNLFEHITETSLNEKEYQKFQENFTAELSDIFAKIAIESKHPEIYKTFRDRFNVDGSVIDSEVISPLINELNELTTKYEELADKVSSKVDEDIRRKTVKLDDLIDVVWDKLEDYGLLENSKVLVVRDNYAEALSQLSIAIWNKKDNKKLWRFCINILDVAIYVVGTQRLRNELEEGKNTIKGILKRNNIV